MIFILRYRNVNAILIQPDEIIDDPIHDGYVERSRRATGVETVHEELTYTLTSLGGAPCILARTDCLFQLDYRTLRYGVRTVKVELPVSPEVGGSCVREGDTAVLTLRWSVFNFSLVFTKNPEGNSYYLNKALLKYNQSLDIFEDATYRGPVYLSTAKKRNFYFTPLGHSYACRHGEDQGPLNLFNVDDEIVGNMTLYNSKFQPFVKRAKGKWGPDDHCLPKSIQVMREDVVPFVTSGCFLACVALLLAGYGLFRKLYVKKTDFEGYDPNAEQGVGGGEVYEEHEMTVTNGSSNGHTNGTSKPAQAAEEQYVHAEEKAAPAKPKGSANPFAKGQASNPFRGDGV